jgi:hypothetical protein
MRGSDDDGHEALAFMTSVTAGCGIFINKQPPPAVAAANEPSAASAPVSPPAPLIFCPSLWINANGHHNALNISHNHAKGISLLETISIWVENIGKRTFWLKPKQNNQLL